LPSPRRGDWPILLRCQSAVHECEATGSIMPAITAVERELAQSFDCRSSDGNACPKRLEKSRRGN
jgi:hypothetical protein